jgi:alpha-tubulin suppressor-like RCC1 family protein
VVFPGSVHLLASGAQFTVFSTPASELYGFGNNEHFQLTVAALPSETTVDGPQLIVRMDADPIVRLAAGAHHTALGT